MQSILASAIGQDGWWTEEKDPNADTDQAGCCRKTYLDLLTITKSASKPEHQ